jgi:triacylglycerol esterase/lipase EstA (alpha/beta hydrolase family)
MSRVFGSRRGLLAATALVIFAGAAIFFFVRARPEEPPNLARGGDPFPVILVHGYGGGSTSMHAIEARLVREGRRVVSLDLPDGGVGDISGSAEEVARAVDETGSPTVDLIGFSMGGVVVRSYVADLGGTERARYVMTLASPHHGTKVAGLASLGDPGACTGACEQLAPGSSFLERLNDPDETPEGPAFVTVWTEADETVTPPDSARLDGALNIKVQDVCPGSRVGHAQMVTDPVVLGLIVETLAGLATGVPEPSRCDELGALGT